MLESSDTYEKKEEDWVSRTIADEAIIIPLCRSDEDIQYIYSISNPTGMRIWQLLDGEHSVRHIQEAVKSEFQSRDKAVERDVLEFLHDLLDVQLIQKTRNKAKSSKRNPPAKEKPKRTKASYEKPEITKIKMEPEQAVLSCCTSAVGSVKIGLFSQNWCSFVCEITNCVITIGDNHYKYDGAS